MIKFVDELHNKDNIGIFMFQKEVAERILSSYGSKSYNAFTLKIKSFFNVKKLLDLKMLNKLELRKTTIFISLKEKFIIDMGT